VSKLSSMPAGGVIVIVLIVCLFVLAAIMLFGVCARYRRISRMISGNNLESKNAFLRCAVNDYAAAYKRYGNDVNTPAIISNAMSSKLSSALFCERFLNNAVSLFVTLGLFGTFLGLSLSVASLTELISYSNTSEWLSVLDSVGGGLMSALSGMGVAFYTSLVGVACSIVLTVLRAIFNPEGLREKLSVQMELWLDHTVSPTLSTMAAKDDAQLVHQMIDALNATADSIEESLSKTTSGLQQTLDASRSHLNAFNKTVNSFNEGVRDFSEFNYNLRGTIERMDISVRDLVSAMRQAGRDIERGAGK
jgi:hypothetical protein